MPNSMFQQFGSPMPNFGQGNPLFGGQMPPQGMPQQGPQGSQPPMSIPQGGGGQAPVGVADPGALAPQQGAIDPGSPNIKRGMFGSAFDEGGVGRNVAGSIGDYLLQMAHAAPIFAPNQQYKMRAALEQQQYESRQQSELQRQIALYQFQMEHPNGQLDQYIRQAGLDPHGDQAKALYGQAAQTAAAPLQAFDYNDGHGNITKQFFRPGAMSPVGGGAPPPTAPVGKLTPIQGGQPGQPAATFRY